MAIESAQSGLWSAGATWVGPGIPTDTDRIHINGAHEVNFDVDVSGFGTGFGNLDIDGTLITDSGDDRYLKVFEDITGSGDWFIDNGAGGDWIFDKQMTIDFAGSGSSITGSGGLKLHFRCAEPPNQFVRLTAPASAGDRVLPVDTNVTGLAALWLVGDTVHVANINNGKQIEEHDMSGISANTITIDAPGLTADKLEGAYIFLQNRNIRIINTTDYAIKFVLNSIINAEISNAANGVQGVHGSTVGGAIAVTGFSAEGTNEAVFTGFMTGGSGLRICKNCIMAGSIAGVGNGLSLSTGNVISGLIAGCSIGVGVGSTGNIITGTIDGCLRGDQGNISTFKNATLVNNAESITDPISFSAYNTSFDPVFTEVQRYNAQSRAPWLYSFSVDHDKVPGAFKAWLRGGIVTNDTGVKPPGEIQSYKHACEDADNPVFKQDAILIQPGDTFVYAVDARKDASMSFLPRAQLLLPEEDPLVDASNTPLDEAIMTNSIDTWEELALTYTNTTDYPVEVLIRTLAMNATGNAWFLVEGGKFSDVAGSTLDAVANDGTGTSATLTITPPASGLYEATKTRYRKVNDSDWSDGGEFVGTQGVQGTHQITGLSNNTSYEFFVVAHFDTAHSFPSDILRRWISSDTGPIAERILDDIESSIEMITKGNGYSQTIESGNVVRREGTPWTAFECYPAVDIWLVQDIKTDEETMGYQGCHMEVEVRAYVYDGNDIDQALSIIAADIEKALAVDHTRGGNAIDTDTDEIEHIFADDSKGKPNGMVIITLDVKFEHLRNDPYN